MAINGNVLAENQATVLADDGNVMYATIQMRHGKESEMDKNKFVPAEIGVATDTKKAFMAFGSNQVKEMMFREDSEIEELLGEVREISDQAVEAVESAEATAKQTIQDFTDQMKATIPEDYTETVKKIDILERTKAPAIYKTASGESLQIEDSADAPVAGLKVYGKGIQNGTPTPDSPVDIEIPGSDGEIEVSMTGNLVNIDDFVATSNATISRSGNELKVASSTRYMGAQLKLNDYIDILKGQKITAWAHVKATNTTLYIVQLMYTIDGRNKYTTIKENSNQGMWRKVEVDIPNGNITNIQISINPINNGNADTEAYVVVDDIGIIIGSWNESQISGLPFSEPVQVNLSTPNGLPGIPVDSNGNYTDSDGQQWICDEVDFERGKYVQRVQKVVCDGSEVWEKAGTYVERYYKGLNPNAIPGTGLSNYFVYLSGGETVGRFTINTIGTSVGFAFKTAGAGTSVEDWKDWLNQKNVEGKPLTLYYCLLNPIETDLSEEELAAYAALRTNYPTTVVTSDSDPAVDMEIEYVADTKTYIDNKLAELAQNLAATQNTLLEV